MDQNPSVLFSPAAFIMISSWEIDAFFGEEVLQLIRTDRINRRDRKILFIAIK
jgi:hypothetical protein